MAPSNKDNLFGAKKQASLKASGLDSTVKEIIASEQMIRERKTARLRELRLEKEALQPPPEPKTKTKRKIVKPSE